MKKETNSASTSRREEDHTQALLRLINETAHRWSPHQVFSDFVEMACLAISNVVDRRQYEAREARYLEIVGKYPREDVERFPRMLGRLTLALEQCCLTGVLEDVLGKVYMLADLGNDRAGQFFTPYEISRLMAGMLMGDGAQVREQGFIDLMEPTCGAGGMVIAFAEALQHAGLNYQSAMHATCIDIDARCAHMTYLQLSLLHIPAIVLHGNSLTDEVWSRWYTPAHVLGGWRRRSAKHRAREPIPLRVDEPQVDPLRSETAVLPQAAAAQRMVEQLKLFED